MSANTSEEVFEGQIHRKAERFLTDDASHNIGIEGYRKRDVGCIDW